MRQRWTVSDPFKGYDKEAHYWYVPQDIPIDKAEANTFIKKFNLENEKGRWPIKSANGRKLSKPERRTDLHMPYGSGKPLPFGQKDINHNIQSRPGYKNGLTNYANLYK